MPPLRPLLSSAMDFLLRKRNDLKASSFARSGGDHHGCRSNQKCVNCGNDSPPEARTCHLQDLHLAVVLSDLVKPSYAWAGVVAKDWRKVAKKRQIYEMEPELILLIKGQRSILPRNYRSYFLFVSTTTLLFIFIFVVSALHIKFLVDGDCATLLEAIKNAPTSLALLIYSFVSVLWVGFLSAYHLYLIGTNQTTREELKNRLEKKQSIYDRGWLNNFAQILCTKINPSRIDLRGFIQEEAVKPLPVISLPETEDLQVNSRMKVVDRGDVDQDLPKLSPHRNHIEVDMEMGWTERDG